MHGNATENDAVPISAALNYALDKGSRVNYQ